MTIATYRDTAYLLKPRLPWNHICMYQIMFSCSSNIFCIFPTDRFFFWTYFLLDSHIKQTKLNRSISIIEDQILKRLGDGYIITMGICCRKDGCYERQTFVRHIGKILLLQRYVFRIGRFSI